VGFFVRWLLDSQRTRIASYLRAAIVPLTRPDVECSRLHPIDQHVVEACALGTGRAEQSGER